MKRTQENRALFKSIILLVLLFSSVMLRAAPIDRARAEKAAKGWLKRNPAPITAEKSQHIDSIITVSIEDETVYFVANLSPYGFLIISPDDRLEPVVAFSGQGKHVPDEDSPLYQIARLDLAARQRQLRSKFPPDKNRQKNLAKWFTYLRLADSNSAVDVLASNMSDLRVAPIIQSQWGQENEGGLPCYDYYTPPGSEPDTDPNNNIRCGCVATAMAQIMRYHQRPSGDVGVSTYTVSVNGDSRTAFTRGGDGSGGPYQWYNMPLIPGPYPTETQRQAIGTLCHDAGVTVHMQYSPSGSGTSMSHIHRALSEFFQYSSAIYGVGSSDAASSLQKLNSMPPADLNQMMNPGLDGGFPSIIGLDGPVAGHAVVVDGYGYQDGTLYHHLNMGWYGRDNAWYALPDVNSMPYFNIIDACIYNIFPYGSGEIISGRALDALGLPLGGTLIQAYLGSDLITQDYTNEKGIYALAQLPSEQTYFLHAEKEGCVFQDQSIYVGKSFSEGDPNEMGVTGNRWGIDFQNIDSDPPVAVVPSGPIVHTGSGPLQIILQATDDGLPNPPGELVYIITALPAHGTLYDGGFGEITVVPYTLQNDSNSVIYDPCGSFRGTDTFSFKVNDGGLPPWGGDSNTAQVSILIKDQEVGQTAFYSNYPFFTSRHDCRMQLIYTVAEFGSAAQIGGLSFNFKMVPGKALSQFTIRMQHTDLNEYSAGRDFINTGWTVVYQNTHVIAAGGWNRINFQTPFTYNGINNILLDISFNNTSSAFSNGQVYGFSAPNRDIIQVSNSMHGDPLLWTVSMFGGYLSQNFKPSLKIHEYSVNLLEADFSGDCRVDYPDLLMLADAWLTQAGGPFYNDLFDIAEPQDFVINLKDFGILAAEWLESSN